MEIGEYDKEIKCWANKIEPWRESARGVITEGWEIEEVSEVLADELASKVTKKELKVDQLRQGVIWANALEEEAQNSYGSDLSSGDYRFERTARRIMHHAGRMALEQVKNRRKRTILSVRRGNLGVLSVE